MIEAIVAIVRQRNVLEAVVLSDQINVGLVKRGALALGQGESGTTCTQTVVAGDEPPQGLIFMLLELLPGIKACKAMPVKIVDDLREWLESISFTTVGGLFTRLNYMEQRVPDSKDKVHSLEKSNQYLEKKVVRLNDKWEQIEDHARRSDLWITGIMEHSEDTVGYIKLVDKTDSVFCNSRV
ncbi:hypothetical protein NDU88_007441 [Pleurodeles waltl]|uniref:Uncharacterized protein n=1 Tax=Pleurodeles waltl TaxID=8319 RepID=A0AAV7P266_PLEWA|nr:hypothetical protein NDU88_007441 [Pleurodeles waltl]